MHDVGRSQFAQGGQIESLVGHSPDVSQALEPSRSPWKRRIDRHKLHFVPLNPEVIGKHLGLHGLAPQECQDSAQPWRFLDEVIDDWP